MTDPDIVTRLRAVLHNDRSVELRNREAADEIERLRDERDEARRMYCEEAFCHRFNERGGEATIIDSRQIAHSMGWDCFKENNND
jgi:hypothetical protein